MEFIVNKQKLAKKKRKTKIEKKKETKEEEGHVVGKPVPSFKTL